MPSKLECLQSLRGIAVLLVVLLHTYAFEPKAGLGPLLLPQFTMFGSSGVDLFFVISGFVMVYTTQTNNQGWTAVRSFLYKRFTRIYPLYWVYTGVLLFGYLALPNLVQRPDLAEVGLLKALLLIPQEPMPYLVVGWTLIHEMYFYLVFSILLFLPRKLLSKALCSWLLGLVIFSGTLLANKSPSLQLLTHPLTFEFILGCLVALLVLHRPPRTGRAIVVFGILTLFGGWSLHYFLSGGTELTGWQRASLLGIPYALIVLGLTSLELDHPICRSSFLEHVGDASYSIYLAHFLVISVISKIWANFPETPFDQVSSYLDNILFICLSVFASVAFGSLSYKFIERSLTRYFRIFPQFFAEKFMAYKPSVSPRPQPN